MRSKRKWSRPMWTVMARLRCALIVSPHPTPTKGRRRRRLVRISRRWCISQLHLACIPLASRQLIAADSVGSVAAWRADGTPVWEVQTSGLCAQGVTLTSSLRDDGSVQVVVPTVAGVVHVLEGRTGAEVCTAPLTRQANEALSPPRSQTHQAPLTQDRRPPPSPLPSPLLCKLAERCHRARGGRHRDGS